MSDGAIYCLNSCQSRFSGVYLVFEVFQDTWRSNGEILVHTGMLPCHSDLVLISFWMLTMPWICYPISFYGRVSRFVAFQTKVAHLCLCLFA